MRSTRWVEFLERIGVSDIKETQTAMRGGGTLHTFTGDRVTSPIGNAVTTNQRFVLLVINGGVTLEDVGTMSEVAPPILAKAQPIQVIMIDLSGVELHGGGFSVSTVINSTKVQLQAEALQLIQPPKGLVRMLATVVLQLIRFGGHMSFQSFNNLEAAESHWTAMATQGQR